MAILSTILNLILWIWIIQVAAGVLMYCVALSKSFRQRGHSASSCIDVQPVDSQQLPDLPRIARAGPALALLYWLNSRACRGTEPAPAMPALSHA